ncbi:hypothetical protein [Brevibacillus laterosporus]|uniref:hypothetical protein n=1 Tax=Brevibacillus laterosporus TaxID=1465 RepID=UPI00215D3AEF|nr:hypothetical protein [Brevibacillus laterosporus]MCR8994583.1 hypothetical protein [Brevibacillus laterosporus]
MTVSELIEKLKQFNPEAKVVCITAYVDRWDYTNNPTITATKNMFGERVFIQ